MLQLARYLLQTLRWKPAFLIDAKVDAWRLSLPRERTEAAKAVAKLTTFMESIHESISLRNA